MKPGTVVDRYVVEGLAGAGAVGAVYRVRHSTLGTIHALKVLGFCSEPARLRFEREARIQARLVHPNVVRVTDLVLVDRQPALIAEFVDGPDLACILEEAEGRLPLPQALDIFRQVVAGVQAAHAHGVVHRDIKPHNVLVSWEEGRPRAKVCDFGIARIPRGEEGGPALTRTGGTMGTPAYMSPEQHEDAAGVDARADIFSLGCMLYELCLGQRPFREESIVGLALAARAESYPHPSTLDPSLPVGLQELIVACLRADPAQRLPSCAVLAARLDALSLVAPSPAPAAAQQPPSPAYLAAGETVLPEDLDDDPSVEAPAETRAPRAGRSVRGAAALAGLLLLLAGGVRWALPETEARVTAPPPAEVAAPGPVAEAELPVEESPWELAAAPPPLDPAPAESARGAATVPAPTPARVVPNDPVPVSSTAAGGTTSALPDQARLRLADDGVRVRLVGEGGSYPPGPLPPGHYLVRATFEGQEEVDAGYVSVRAGEETLLRCNPTFAQCRRSD